GKRHGPRFRGDDIWWAEKAQGRTLPRNSRPGSPSPSRGGDRGGGPFGHKTYPTLACLPPGRCKSREEAATASRPRGCSWKAPWPPAFAGVTWVRGSGGDI